MYTWPTSFDKEKVFLRADLNVTLIDGVIQDDFRLQKIEPTIKKIFEKEGRIVLATHIGRPQGTIIPALSTHHLISWFEKRGYTISFAPTIAAAKEVPLQANSIVLLENLRFFPGEQQHDSHFAQELASLGSYYVNDAFATLHRNDTSITLVPLLFETNKRFLGPLIEEELMILSKLRTNPEKPYIAFIGGGKVTTKIPLLKALVHRATTLVLMPAVVFTFLKAHNKQIGKSLFDQEALLVAQDLIEHHHDKFIYPLDYLVAINSIQGSLRVFTEQTMPQNALGISIGPESLEKFKDIIMNAKTIFFNAASYFPHKPETMEPLLALLTMIAQSSAFSVIAGGESVAAARKAGLEDQVSYLSTGGGASLTYLAGQPLPGLQPFEQSKSVKI